MPEFSATSTMGDDTAIAPLSRLAERGAAVRRVEGWKLPATVRRALRAMDLAGLPWQLVETSAAADGPAATIALASADLPRLRRVLGQSRFLPVVDDNAARPFRYVGYDWETDTWPVVAVQGEPGVPGGADSGTAQPLPLAGRLIGASRLRSWLSALTGRAATSDTAARVGLTVALLGPDGSGKSTVASRVAATYALPVSLLYLGLWQRSSVAQSEPKWPGASLFRRLLWAWRTYLSGQYLRAQGKLVIFDRYTFDALLSPADNPGLPRRLYGWLLGRACPPPDLTIVLDVAGEVAYGRKSERNPAQLEWERQGFLSLRGRVPGLVVVDANRPLAAVQREVTDLIWGQHCARN